MRRTLLALVCLAALNGCASLAKQPATPARDLSATAMLAVQPPPGERYYLIVFGSESRPKVPRYTHSWATVVRVTEGSPGSAPEIEANTISWMPATLDIHPWNFRVEPGTNLDLCTSLREAQKNDESIYMWGPYEVWHGFYNRFRVQKQFVESGSLGYQCIDSIGEAARTGCGCDCIHAITDMDPQFDRGRYPLQYFGAAASEHIVKQVLSRGISIGAPRTHDWLLAPLGLDRFPICRKAYRGKVLPFSPEAIAAQTDRR